MYWLVGLSHLYLFFFWLMFFNFIYRTLDFTWMIGSNQSIIIVIDHLPILIAYLLFLSFMGYDLILFSKYVLPKGILLFCEKSSWNRFFPQYMAIVGFSFLVTAIYRSSWFHIVYFIHFYFCSVSLLLLCKGIDAKSNAHHLTYIRICDFFFFKFFFPSIYLTVNFFSFVLSYSIGFFFSLLLTMIFPILLMLKRAYLSQQAVYVYEYFESNDTFILFIFILSHLSKNIFYDFYPYIIHIVRFRVLFYHKPILQFLFLYILKHAEQFSREWE